MNLTYTLWTNLDSRYARAFAPGDRLVRGHTGELNFPADSPTAAAEEVFTIHNRGNRPDGRTAPSLSVGDVVQFADVVLSVDHAGFVEVDLDTAVQITDCAWSEMTTAERA